MGRADRSVQPSFVQLRCTLPTANSKETHISCHAVKQGLIQIIQEVIIEHVYKQALTFPKGATSLFISS